MRRVVDDEVDAGEVFERADVSALATDDPTLEIVGRELDHGDRRLCCVARGNALERVRDERARPTARVRSRFLLHLPHLSCELVPHEILRTLDQLLPCFVNGQTRDLLERAECIPVRISELLLKSLDVNLAISEPLLLALDLGESGVDLELLGEHPLL